MTTVVCDPPLSARGRERRATSPVRVARPRAARRPCGGARRTAPGGRAATRPLRVRWRRVAALALLVAAAVVAGVVIGRGPVEASAVPGAPAADAGTAAAADVATGTVLVVGPGETIWGLVAAHAPDGVAPAAYVAEVVAVNDVDPLRVAPGTVIRLP